MKVVFWKFNNIKIPMIRINGKRYTTSYVLAAALGVTESNLRHLYNRFKEEFDETCLSVNGIHAKDLAALDKFRETFGIERLRPTCIYGLQTT